MLGKSQRKKLGSGEIAAKFKISFICFRIHSQGNMFAAKNHPDSRAIFFEEKIYSKRKIQDFLLTLSGFGKLQKALNFLKNEDLNSSLLRACADCPDLTPELKYFEDVLKFTQLVKFH